MGDGGTASVDYVIYGSTPWDGPWLTEQNLANALAPSHRVLYVEPPRSPLSPFRYGVSWDAARKLARLIHPRMRATDGLKVLTPLTLPPAEHPRARAASLPLLHAQLAHATRSLKFSRPVVIAARAVLDLQGAVGERALVYLVKDLNEAGEAMLGKDPELIATQVAAMCARADLVVAVTKTLQETLTSRGFEAQVLRHGFHADLAPLYDRAPLPPEYATMPAPRIGYAGHIDARLDFDALTDVADRFPDGSLILVGPVSPRLPQGALEPLRRRQNVHMLGPRDRLSLPGYLRHLSCCLMPYRENEWLRHGSPLKLWDYLYAGPPLVGSGCTALRNYRLVAFADSAASLPELVSEVLHSDAGSRAERQAFAMANTWDHRATELDKLVTTALGESSH